MWRVIKKSFYLIYASIAFTIKALLALINGIFLLALKAVSIFFNRFRFSIAFKINLLYSGLYILLFAITYFIGTSIFLEQAQSENLSFDSLIMQFSILMGIMMLISLAIFFLLGKHIVEKMLKPLKDMTTTVKEIKGTDLVTRLDTKGAKDELKDLALTFNEMMDRIEVFVERQKQFASDASHELRTPVAIIQGYTDMLNRWGKDDPKILEESIQSITQETANMKNLLEKLLFLSRSDKNTLKVEMQLIDLSKICRDVLKETSFIDDEHDLLSKVEDNVQLVGDPALIKELIRILVDNALKYTPEGGCVTLGCAITKQNIVLSVKDNGIGIPKEHIPHLFERFYRVDEARNKNTGGTGLGLAIAHQICATHQAKIFVYSTLGEGTEFVIFFAKPSTLELSNQKETC
nr:ATP-binding protein [uncultured Cellulosilyticum sp.]